MLDRIPFRGENLRVARNYCNLTLAELGEKVCVKGQYIHQLETEKKPSPTMVEALSAALGFRPGFFSKPLSQRIQGDECHFRKLQTTSKNQKDHLAAHATLFVHVLDFLDERLSLPEFKIPEIPVTTPEDVERAAEVCRDHWGIPKNAPIKSMTRLVESFGVPIASFSGFSREVDAFSCAKGRPIIVRSTDKESGSRSRLDLAHECGHLVMHRNVEPGQKEPELQAFRFAGALLFPKEAFIREFPRGGPFDWRPLLELKARWGISLIAMIYRASDLGIIDGTRARWAYIDINRKDWRKHEPQEFPIEPTELMPLAFNALAKVHKINSSQAALQLDMGPQILEAITGFPVPRLKLTD